MSAQFSIKMEQLAYQIRPQMEEADSFTVYPDVKVFATLRRSRTRAEIWDNFPTELKYNI